MAHPHYSHHHHPLSSPSSLSSLIVITLITLSPHHFPHPHHPHHCYSRHHPPLHYSRCYSRCYSRQVMIDDLTVRRWMKETDRGGKGYVDYSDYTVHRPRLPPPPSLSLSQPPSIALVLALTPSATPPVYALVLADDQPLVIALVRPPSFYHPHINPLLRHLLSSSSPPLVIPSPYHALVPSCPPLSLILSSPPSPPPPPPLPPPHPPLSLRPCTLRLWCEVAMTPTR